MGAGNIILIIWWYIIGRGLTNFPTGFDVAGLLFFLQAEDSTTFWISHKGNLPHLIVESLNIQGKNIKGVLFH
jgi:hypothetical protein